MSAQPRIFDPRIGDEDDVQNDTQASSENKNAADSLAEKQSTSSSGKNEADNHKEPKSKRPLPKELAWIPASWSWANIKPVIRCAVVGWVCLLFVIIPQTSKALGQASFLILVAAFISPPNDAFICVLERALFQVFFVTLSWAWCSLGIKLGNLARSNTNYSAPIASIYNGDYLEPGPTAIMAVFLFTGSAFMLYVKAKQGPGPFLFATVFSCIAIDINLTTAILFPYDNFKIGQGIIIPIAMAGAISLFFSAILFPSTVSSLFTKKCHAVVAPLITVLSEHQKLLKMSAHDPTFSAAKASALITGSEAALAPLAATLNNLKRDIVWSRVSPSEFAKFYGWARRLVVRANGMSVYFSLIDPTRERFPVTPAPSHPATPIVGSPPVSRPQSLHEGTEDELPSESDYPESTIGGGSPHPSVHFARRRRMPHIHLPHSALPNHHTAHEHVHHKQHLTHGSLLHLALAQSSAPKQAAVGAFESHRYANIETKVFSNPEAADYTEKFHRLLGDSSEEVLEVYSEVLTRINTWFDNVMSSWRFSFWCRKGDVNKERVGHLQSCVALKEKLDTVLERFRNERRHAVIDPYRSGFDAESVGSGIEPPPHRHLFHCYVYQYHLIQFGLILSEFMGEIIRLKKERPNSRLWTPSMSLGKFFSWSSWQQSDNMEREDDENPDVIHGMESEQVTDLGSATRRDPDALPPRNALEWFMNLIYVGICGLSKGDALFALKAGLLTVLLSIPSFIHHSAAYAYQNKFVWGIFIGQLTLVRFQGDTTFGLVSRLTSTFGGCVLGAIVWYISTGTGHGNAYGLAASCAAAFPFFFYARLYWPITPITNIIMFVTSALVIGYSWIDTHPQFPSTFLHWGVDIAIRRFVLVACGVVAAFIFSFLPPTTTLRKYQRHSLATTSNEIGSIYCSIVSYANTRKHSDEELQEIVQSLIAIRMKLKKSIALKTNITYEFSLRGRWPAKRYGQIVEIQLQIAYMLSHLLSVVEHLEPAWSRAFLRRSRFLEADFQGEVLAVINMVSTSLRTGTPLPQITPCPLLDRFTRYHHGLNVVRQEADGDYGLPKTMTVETLEDEQYLFFCVGISTAFGIINRLDRLMVATKEVVGEQYHIHGIGLFAQGGEGGAPKSSDVRPMKDA